MRFWDGVRRALRGGKERATMAAQPQSEPTAAPDERAAYISAIRAERALKDRFLASDPYGPLSPEQRDAFEGLRYFEPDPALRFEVELVPLAEPRHLVMQTSTGDEQPFAVVGTITFEVEGQPATLHVYEPVGGGDFFLPFRDGTSGQESYGAGRYLEPHAIGRGRLLVDFNLAYNPYCAYNEGWSCPVPPLENWLKVPIRAGEQNPDFHPGHAEGPDHP